MRKDLKRRINRVATALEKLSRMSRGNARDVDLEHFNNTGEDPTYLAVMGDEFCCRGTKSDFCYAVGSEDEAQKMCDKINGMAERKQRAASKKKVK